MKLETEELEQIAGFVQAYKALPEQRRAELKALPFEVAYLPKEGTTLLKSSPKPKKQPHYEKRANIFMFQM